MTDDEITEAFNARIRLGERTMAEFDHVAFARDIVRIERMEDMCLRMGKACMRFIDRANDVSEQDPAERILSEWAAEVNKIFDEFYK